MRDEGEEFAALLRRLKDRTDRSYGSLARRVNMNTSTLHRYCTGEAVPQDFAPVERLAAFCEATPTERLELHRLWLSAVAARQRVRTAGSAEAAVPAPAPDLDSGGALVEESGSVEQPGDRPDPDQPIPSPAPRPWYRRRRVLASTAVVCALLATPLSTSALPDDRSSETEASRPAGSRTNAPGVPRRSAKPAATGSPSSASSPSAAPSRSSTSSGPGQKTPAPSAAGSGPTSAAKPATGLPLAWSTDSLVWDKGCGGDLTPRRFTVDLDADRPVARPKDGAGIEQTVPAVHFPYRVSAEDPEVLLVDAMTQAHDARWYLELDWSSQGRTGTIRIDDHGRPFRTTGIRGMPHYWYGTNDAGGRAWVPYDG